MKKSLRLALACLALVPAAAFAQPSGFHLVDGAELPMNKVVNGVLEFGQPAVVEIRDQTGALCSGTLVGCRYVLTAANCFCTDPGSGISLSGAECANRADLLNPSQYSVFFQHGGIAGVESIKINPSFLFEEGQEKSDVAMVRLDTVVDGIPPTSISRVNRPGTGSVGKIVGFGRSTAATDLGLKRNGNVVIAGCTEVPSANNLCWNFADPLGAPGTDANSCDGDAGGPLLVDFGTGAVVAGVMSAGVNAECTAPDQAWNSDVAAERSWIESIGGGDLNRTRCGDLPQALKDGSSTLGATAILDGANREWTASFDVPASVAVLRLAMHGEEFASAPAPNFDLFIRADQPPTEQAFDCRSNNGGIVEYCEIQKPDPGRWHVLVKQRSGAGRFQIASTYFAVAATICTPGPTVLCPDNQTGDRRFKVTIDYESPPRLIAGQGRAISTSSLGIHRGGLFWFFTPDNPEVLVKVLNGCGINNKFWVYLTAGTDVGHTVTVTDTTTGVSKTYTNPDLHAAEPVQDVQAFACP